LHHFNREEILHATVVLSSACRSRTSTTGWTSAHDM